jgi:hypothetical protein
MDPSQVQSDHSNDVHSLEHEGEGEAQAKPEAAGAGGAGESLSEAQAKKDSGDVTDATGGSTGTPAAPSPFKHRSFIRRLWDKFNIYMILFILVLVLAVGALVMMTFKGQQDNNKPISTESLSDDALKQLANTDVTVGNSKQILTVQANAVFAGAVLIRGDLEVAGALKLGGDLSLANLTVTGNSKLGDIESSNITVGNSLNVQGTLTLKSGISVAGQSNFNGGIVTSSLTTDALNLNGNLRLTKHVTAGGTIPSISKGTAVGSGGTVSLSGSDTSGSINVNTGGSPPAGCFATVTFSEPFKSTPHVVVSPIGASAGALDFYITRSTTNFVVCTANPAPVGVSFGFDYMAFE